MEEGRSRTEALDVECAGEEGKVNCWSAVALWDGLVKEDETWSGKNIK